MSHYASSLCFLKIKRNLRSDFLNTMESYYSTITSDEMEAVYKACEDFADWSNYVEDCIPSHLRELFKSDE